MRWSNIELFIVCVFLILVIAEFVQVSVQIRLFGPNLLHPRIWQYVVMFVILIGNPRAYMTKSMGIVYLYAAILLVFGLAGHYVSERYQIVGAKTMDLLPVSLAVTILLKEHYIRPEKKNELRFLIKVMWCAYILVCLLSLYVIYRHPGSVRGTGITYYRYDSRSYMGMGLGGYGFFSSLPFLIPVIFYFTKHPLHSRRSNKILAIILLCLFLVTSYKGVIFVPFFISLMALAFSALGRKRFKTSIRVLLIVVILYAFIPRHVIGNAFVNLSYMIPNEDMSTKLRDVGNTYITGLHVEELEEGEGTTVEHRASRIAINVEQFVHNPLLGAGKAGNPHLYWLNQLGQFGLIGVFPLMWVMVVQFGFFRKKHEEYRFFYVLSIISYLTLLLLKAHGGYHFYLAIFFMVPGSFYLDHDFLLQDQQAIIDTRTKQKQTMHVDSAFRPIT